MYSGEELYSLSLNVLNSIPYECVDWDTIRWVVHNIKEDSNYYVLLTNIYVSAVKNTLVYLRSNNAFLGCPGNIAKHMIAFLGTPSYLTNHVIKGLIFREIYLFNFCTCNQPYCDFSNTGITPHQ
jgi:hypothetical protein